jgi:transcriptional regulator with XRE-family HTH domain/predicted transcriptional regulator
MKESSKDLRLILGLKLRNLRQARSEGLREIADRAGLSVSYLSELEQGKKYPKPDKLLRLAEALEVPFDELVSLKVSPELGPLKQAVSSGFLREFPFELFGLEREDLVHLIAEAPGKSGALIQSLVDIGRTYDVQVEHFLLSALRAYQQMNANYFDDLERAAADFRRDQGWLPGDTAEESVLRYLLESRWGYSVDTATIGDHPDLGGFRSVFVQGRHPILYVNGRLLPAQRAFILAREIGYRSLELKERAATSSWLQIESFAQVLNNFKASYFAGALLIDRDSLGSELEQLFSLTTWDSQRLLDCMVRYQATPEMFFYRLTELVPQRFGLEKLFFLRFHWREDPRGVALTKVFNLSGVSVPYGVGLKEHYCRRWPGLILVTDPTRVHGAAVGIEVQRSRFLNEDVEFFVIALGRALTLDTSARTSVSLGFLMDEKFRKTARFWDDPAVCRVDVNLTCERCALSRQDCPQRVAEPAVHHHELEQLQKERALAELAASSQLV